MAGVKSSAVKIHEIKILTAYAVDGEFRAKFRY